MVGFIYTVAEGGLVSIIVPDNDAQLETLTLSDGEALLHVTDFQYAEIKAAFAAARDMQAVNPQLAGEMFEAAKEMQQGLVNAHTGKPSPPARQAIVDAAGLVVDVIFAYPSNFELADGFQMIASKTATTGDSFVNGVLVPRFNPDPEPEQAP